MEPADVTMLYSKANVVNSLMDKISKKCKIEKPMGRKVEDLYERLNLLKN